MKTKSMSQFDKMTKTPVSRLIIKLSIPAIISMMVTSVYNLVDTAFVGQLGNSASGAVGIVFGFMAVLQAIGFMFGNGSGSIISRLLGAKNTEQASKIASTGFFFTLLFGAVVAIISAFVLKPLVMLLGSTETISPYAQTYISYILVAAPFITASFTMNNLLRYEGKATLGMIGLIVGAVLNIAGDPILMFGLNMGIAGAGLSTCISQIIGFFVLLSMFLLHKTQCRLSVKLIVPKFLPEIIGTGLPSLLRQGLNSLSTVVLNNCAAVYGDAAVAAMSIVSRVIFFTFSFALGVGQGFQPVCGFNYGAKKYDRLKTAFYFSVMLAEIIVVVMSVGLILFPGEIVRIFRDDNTVMEIGSRALVLQGIAQLFLPFCMITEMALQSVGKMLGASVLSTLRNGLFFIPLLLILSNVRGLSGIQEAQPLAVTLAVIPSAILAVRFFRELPKNTEQSRGEAENER
ncbi:MAG: MATE family efflux transporter [Ruminococcus sp.]|nr:MATE family efflux transporter [Ruminococcus sp.]